MTNKTLESQDSKELSLLQFDNTKQLVDDLWNEIRINGMYGRSKTDFYDYVLYLLNKYDSGHFLSSNDNAANERLLKINATRIKSAKKNISVKFMDDNEYEKIFSDFINKIANGKLPFLSDDGKSYTMVIEDVALRSIIETKLKRITNTTLDYKLNNELVSIEHRAFIEMLVAEIKNNPSDINNLLEEIVKELKKDKNKQDLWQIIENTLSSDSFASLGIKALKEIASYVYRKTSAND